MRGLLIFLGVILQICVTVGFHGNCPRQSFDLTVSPTPISVNTAKFSKYHPIGYQNLSDITSLTYDPTDPRFLFTKAGFPNRIYVLKFGFSDWNPIIYLEYDDEDFKEITFDSITRNFYYISEDFSIGVCNPKLEQCTRLIDPSNLVPRQNLVLNPKIGKMYWIEQTRLFTTVVYGSNMDGTNVSTLFGKKFDDSIPRYVYERISSGVYALTLDQKQGFLYVLTRDMIIQFNPEATEFTKFDQFSIIHSDKNNHLEFADNHAKINDSLFYFNCALYYLDRSTYSLMVYTKNNQPSVFNPYYGLIFTRPFGMIDATAPDNQCTLFDCDGICIISKDENESRTKAKCIINKDRSNTTFYIILIPIIAILLPLFAIFLIIGIKYRLFSAFREWIGRLLGTRRYTIQTVSKIRSNSVFYVNYDNY